MKKIMEIVQRPTRFTDRKDHVLYSPAQKVQIFDEKLRSDVDHMITTMHHEEGIGIAAPQVGISQQIFIIEASLDSSRYPFLRKYPQLKPVAQQIFINPRITQVSKEYIKYWHGCLSAKGLDRGLVRTYKSLHFEAQNLEGEVFKGYLDSFAAIIFQHEFRHLLGSLYIDHAKELISLETFRDLAGKGKIEIYSETLDTKVPHLLSDYKINETIDEYRIRKMSL